MNAEKLKKEETVSYTDTVSRLRGLPPTWYPGLLRELVGEAYEAGVFIPGGASYLVQCVEQNKSGAVASPSRVDAVAADTPLQGDPLDIWTEFVSHPPDVGWFAYGPEVLAEVGDRTFNYWEDKLRALIERLAGAEGVLKAAAQLPDIEVENAQQAHGIMVEVASRLRTQLDAATERLEELERCCTPQPIEPAWVTRLEKATDAEGYRCSGFEANGIAKEWRAQRARIRYLEEAVSEVAMSGVSLFQELQDSAKQLEQSNRELCALIGGGFEAAPKGD